MRLDVSYPLCIGNKAFKLNSCDTRIEDVVGISSEDSGAGFGMRDLGFNVPRNRYQDIVSKLKRLRIPGLQINGIDALTKNKPIMHNHNRNNNKGDNQMRYKPTWVYGILYKNPQQAIFDILVCDGGVDTITDTIRVIQYVMKVFKIKDKEKVYQQYLQLKSL